MFTKLTLLLSGIGNSFVINLFKMLTDIPHHTGLFQISIKKTFAVHMTYNKETAPPCCSLPIDVRSLFRMVSLVKPDFSLILKAKCAAMGFRAPAVLGARLKALTELARDEL